MFGLISVTGTFTVAQGEFTVAEDAAGSTIDVSVLAESFGSGNPKRDTHIRSAEYLEAAAHPEIVFRSASIQQGSGTTAPGELTVRGVVQPCVLTISSLTGDDKTVTAKATTTVDRYAFGLTKQKGMVGRQTILEIEVVAVRESDPASSPAVSETPAEVPAEAAVEAPAEPVAEPSTDEAPTAEAVVEAPTETPAEAPAETSTEASTETPAETPEETSAEPLAEAPAETAAETPTDASAEAPAETPAEAPAEPSAETPDQPRG